MARRRGTRRGGLSDDELELWAQVARSVTPRAPAPPRPQAPPPSLPKAPAPIERHHALVALSPRPVAVPAGFRVGASAPTTTRVEPPVSPAERLAAQPVRMDAKTHRRLSRGKLRPEARIDLHGMTLAVAKAELTGFILSARASGRRLVLVITGKGKGDHGPLPTRSGALRHEVPHWLAMPPLGAVVMQVVPAHLRHGGGGAYYVYLRRA